MWVHRCARSDGKQVDRTNRSHAGVIHGRHQQKAQRLVVAHFETSKSQPAPPFTIEDVTLRTGLVDYYKMLNIEKTANLMDIKAAYRQLQKKCHPDILGDEQGHDMSILLNDAYTVLSNELTRELYDIDLYGSKLEEEVGFTNEAFSVWLPATDPERACNANPHETRALFVDEASCIGCKQCCWAAKDTFILDASYGRARVQNQWADTEENLNLAAEMCPVRCIHWVQREELPVLEHLMKHVTRIGVGVMHSTSTRKGGNTDVFVQAERFKAKKRERRKARKSWTEKFMYSRAQEEAMRRAAGEHVGGGFMGSFQGLQFLMPWFRARIWELFGYGLDRQPSVEHRPRTWKPPTEAGYKGGSIEGDVQSNPSASATGAGGARKESHAAHASTEEKPSVLDCRRAHVLTPEEKAKISSQGSVGNVPKTDGSDGKDMA